jgi:hypothetical protein
MRFNAEKTAFGRHETFALRFGWLTKGAQALMSGDPVFEADDATVLLGVGKNMVSSIRYWLQAARIIERNESGWTLTKIGEYIFDDEGYDPYLEDEATIWLLHFFLLQAWAERANAVHAVKLIVVVLLHQSMDQYAGGLGDTLRNEWAKAQGRFEMNRPGFPAKNHHKRLQS